MCSFADEPETQSDFPSKLWFLCKVGWVVGSLTTLGKEEWPKNGLISIEIGRAGVSQKVRMKVKLHSGLTDLERAGLCSQNLASVVFLMS